MIIQITKAVCLIFTIKKNKKIKTKQIQYRQHSTVTMPYKLHDILKMQL